MRISDWSSDVCSSDLFPDYRIWPEGERAIYTSIIYLEPFDWRNQRAFGYDMFLAPVRRAAMERARDTEIGRASCRASVCQYVSLSVVPVTFKIQQYGHSI